MDSLSQLLLGAVITAGALVLVHFFYTLSKAPHRINLGLSTSAPKSLKGKIYLAAVAISWVVFVFSGAKGLLFWLTPDLAYSAAGLAALAGFFILPYLEDSAYIRQSQLKNLKIRQELEDLIRFATIPNEQTVRRFIEKSEAADTPADKDAYQHMARIAADLAARDNKLWSYAKEEAVKEMADRKKAEQAQLKAAEAISRQQTLRRKLQDLAKTLKVCSTVSDLPINTEALLAPDFVNQHWEKLDIFSSQVKKTGPGPAFTRLVKGLLGVQVDASVSFETELVGNARDGHYEVFAVADWGKGSFLRGLKFEPTVEGCIAAFYLSAFLKTRLCWGHGFYGRDEEALLSLGRMVRILEDMGLDAGANGLEKLTQPTGLRVARLDDNKFVIRCLMFVPSKGFHDYSVEVVDGLAHVNDSVPAFEWSHKIFY